MTDKLRVVIADDERPARSLLVALLKSFDDVEIVAEAENGTQAVEMIELHNPDLALLDLQMPELDGLGVVRLIGKNAAPLIAFVTAYDEYAVRAFELNAVDYLLKPVEKARLREAINRAQERLDRADLRTDELARLLKQYGCGTIHFAGSENASYERHLVFDNVINPAAACDRERGADRGEDQRRGG